MKTKNILRIAYFATVALIIGLIDVWYVRSILIFGVLLIEFAPFKFEFIVEKKNEKKKINKDLKFYGWAKQPLTLDVQSEMFAEFPIKQKKFFGLN